MSSVIRREIPCAYRVCLSISRSPRTDTQKVWTCWQPAPSARRAMARLFGPQSARLRKRQKSRPKLFILADAHLPIGAVNASGNHIDDHLDRPGDWVRQIAVLQDFGPTILFNKSSLRRVLASAVRGGWVDFHTARSPNGTPSLRSGNDRILKVSATEHL
jgi:hypothetical protein